MRIGMFVDMYLPHVSGVTNQVQLLRRGLQSAGHEVLVFTWGKADPGDDPHVHRSPAIPWGDSGWQLPMSLSPEALAAMRTLDIAHAHHPFTSARIALTRCAGAPVVFTNHTRYDIYADHYAYLVPRTLRSRFVSDRLADLSREVSAMLAPSPQIAEWLAGCGADPARIRVFPNTIDWAAFSRPRDPMTKAALGFPERCHLIAHVGRLAPEKNLPLLTQAAEKVLLEDENVCLAIMGDGPLREESERHVAEIGLSGRIKFFGMVEHDRLPDMLAAADSFVTASTSETFALVVMEAGAAGLPVAGVRSPGVGELIIDSVTGLLAEENVGSLAAAMGRLSSDGELASRLGEQASREASEYDVPVVTDMLVELYEELLLVKAAR